jgi:CheY-like chemotaxis protein
MKHLRILVVEADAAIGPLLEEMLEDLGAVVCAVEVDIAKAVSAAARCHPDLMIVDVAVIEAILSNGQIPCVFVTDDNLRKPSLWPGAVLIRKSFRAPEIVAAIRRAMTGRKRSFADALP